MYVLGIETSCDETAAAVVENGIKIISHEVSSSLRFHKIYGGLVPEIAARKQLETIAIVVDCCLKQAKIRLKDIELISVTSGPGFLGSLLVGIAFAKSLSMSLDIPLLGINHLHSHIYASFLERARQTKIFPFIALIISGGHTNLFYVVAFDKIVILGETLDDACGETFDKVAKILGLGYPGGPLIERLSEKGNPHKIKFNCSNTKNPLDFSFSGIKTAVLYTSKAARMVSLNVKEDIASSFQEVVIDTLMRKSFLACKIKKTKQLVIGGGVAANHRLREKFYLNAKKEGLNIYFPSPEFCMDNAAMVAGLGYQLFKKGYSSGLDLTVGLN